MSTRFGWVTSGYGSGPNPADVDLLSHPLAAVVPTIGSLVPGWLLLVPRLESLAFRDLPRKQRQEILALARTLANDVKAFGRNSFVFEHGPSKPLSPVGCGVDQSHIHVAPMNGDLLSLALADETVVWTVADPTDPWRECPSGREYLLISHDDDCYVGFPRVTQSQYFRRKIAYLQGAPEAWDYREWPCHDNAQRTIEHFSSVRAQRRAA
jgi:ATP adenylyltransferase